MTARDLMDQVSTPGGDFAAFETWPMGMMRLICKFAELYHQVCIDQERKQGMAGTEPTDDR